MTSPTNNGVAIIPQSDPNKDGEIILQVRNLSKHFPVGDVFNTKMLRALDDVSFTIRRGQVVALVGESGSGKSTIARLIARLMPATGGEIVFKGRNVLHDEPRRASLRYRRAVQMIFQDPFGSLNPVHSVAHHLTRPMQIHQKVRGRAHMLSQAADLLQTVGLTPGVEFAKKYPHQLSGGQRQRVAVARALVANPELILADEPTSMLDVSIRMGILNLLDQLKTERGLAYLYITHDIASARYIGDEIMVLYAGKLLEGAESDELIQQAAHPYTRLLLAAVPNPHAAAGSRTVEARGEIPSLVDPPPGCPFVPRCPHVMEVCRKVMPGPERLGPNHWVRCHLYGPGAAEGIPAAKTETANPVAHNA